MTACHREPETPYALQPAPMPRRYPRRPVRNPRRTAQPRPPEFISRPG
jgi:hypothetical protein